MDTISVGQIVRLPHGEPVRVEIIYDDGKAKLRRIEGDLAGTVVLCRISSLEPLPENMDSLSDR
jgi:hypothetical protein